MVPTARLELATYALRVRCTTNCAMSAIAQLSYHTFEKSTQISRVFFVIERYRSVIEDWQSVLPNV